MMSPALVRPEPVSQDKVSGSMFRSDGDELLTSKISTPGNIHSDFCCVFLLVLSLCQSVDSHFTQEL